MDASVLSDALDRLHLTTDAVYCASEEEYSELVRSLEALVEEPNPFILVDFAGKGVGSKDGVLSLLQIGLPSKTYVVDVTALDPKISRLAPFLQNRKLQKVVWDGRLGYSELWHRYSIRLDNVLDLQLVYLHERFDTSQRKSFPLSGKITALKERNLISPAEVEVELDRRHDIDPKDWSKRPLPQAHLDYAAAQLSHLRLLTTSLLPASSKFPNILRESKRYIELYHHSRRDLKNPYQTHNYLPQGIIERSEAERSLKQLGTRHCKGCERDLYQESFAVEFRRWLRNPEKQYCYTCQKVNVRRSRTRKFLDVLELVRSRTSSPSLEVSSIKSGNKKGGSIIA